MANTNDGELKFPKARSKRVDTAILHEKMGKFLLNPQNNQGGKTISPKNSSTSLDWTDVSPKSKDDIVYTNADFIWGRQYASLRNHSKRFMQHGNEFQRFHEDNDSLAATMTVYMFFTLIMFPTFIELGIADDDTTGISIHKGVAACAAIMVTIIISMWVSFYYQYNHARSHHHNMFMEVLETLHPRLRNYIVLAITSVFILRLFLRAFTGRCHGDTTSSSHFSQSLNCNPNTDESNLPKESILGLMILPLLISLTMREISVKVYMVKKKNYCVFLLVCVELYVIIRQA
ncbi:hypothetical protein EON63_18630 [archaeon]|nr:MAG: hypothetical protein EON63_18630 [archaeon]